MRRLVSITCVLGLLAFGCGDSGSDGSESGSNDSTSTTGDTFTPATTSTTGPTVEPTTDILDGSSGDPPGPGSECILEANDCSDPNQKCMPWSEDADQIPDGARCCPLQENPDLDGELCTVAEYDGSCIDSCEENTMCVVDNHEDLQGFCRPFCDPEQPSCNGGDGTCKSFFELIPGSFTVPLCMDKCDPLLQDCSPSGWHCIPDSPTVSGQSDFICVPPPPDDPLGAGEPCALANQCEKGLACVPGSRLPDCNEVACCSNYCSLSEGDTSCMDIDPQMVCVDWMAPDPELFDVGVCALPM